MSRSMDFCRSSIRLHALYKSTLTLHFTDVGSPGHRLQSIILDSISSNRLFKAIRVDEPTETRNRPFLNVKFADKGIDALNVSNILNQKSVQNKIPPYFQYKESPYISYSYTILNKKERYHFGDVTFLSSR